ncbi:MAG: metallopeptidase TldD-related protein [Polyangiales bacterium]
MDAPAEAPAPRNDPEVRAALAVALDRARDRARYADLVYERVFKAECNLLADGQVIVKPASLKGAAQVRLVGEGGRHVGVRVGDVSPDALAAAVDQAAAALAAEPPSPRFGLAPIPNPTRERYGIPLTDDPRDAAPTGAFLGLIAAVREAAEAAPEGVRVVPELWAWTQVEEKWVADTDGVYKTQVMPVSFLQVVFRAVRGERQARTRLRFGEAAGLSHYVADGRVTGAVARALAEYRDRAVGLLDARPLTAEERARVTHYVLHHSSLVFIHEGLGHPIEADIARADGSAIVGPDGTPRVDPLGSPVVRIVDGPAPDPAGLPVSTRGFGTELIDDEGVEVQNTVLVEGGRIVGMMHSRETAHHFGVAPTGNGFSQLGDRRVVRMRNTTLCPAPGAHWVDSLTELAKDVAFGVVLHGSLGGAVSKDGMSSSTQWGWLVRDGQVTDEMITAGNFTALTASCLATVEGYAGGVEAHGVGFCGKSGQTRRVTEGGPRYVKVAASPAVTLTFEGQ